MGKGREVPKRQPKARADNDNAWERAVSFLDEKCLLGFENLTTFACGSLWSCAGKDYAWERAVSFLGLVSIPR